VKLRVASLVALAALLPFVGPSPSVGAADFGASDQQNFAQIERGRYLTLLADCAACHTGVDGAPFAGGRPVETPFGVVLAANITPDGATGIGNWDDAQFDAAVRDGKMPDGSRLYPAMPYPYYTKMTRSEVLAIRAYLGTIPPVHNVVVADQLPFPYKIRSTMMLWDALYLTPGEYRVNPSQSAAWNRGAYLVEGPAHCGACHTPKTWLGGDKMRLAYQGYALQGWFAPDITGDEATGLGRWSATDIVEYLKGGHNRFSAASGPMGEEVMDSSSRFHPDDLAAIAEYLKHQPGVGQTRHPLAAGDPVMTAGAAIFEDTCSACHKKDGEGVPYLFPDIAHAPSVGSSDPSSIIRVVLQGANTAATDQEPTGPQMPPFGWQLNDAQVAAVTTYVRNSWTHVAPVVSESDVRSARRSLSLGTSPAHGTVTGQSP
jgi:mono/diheme cytochrome c family protein